jgi:asparagine synthase (glutamine-hydrolysing)
MNRIFGYLALQSQLPPDLVARTQFQNSIWTPDHNGSYCDENVVLTSCQRFITPECHRTLMPYQHQNSGCVIVADVYLTQRDVLCKQLQVSADVADAELILLGFLKWGTDVTRYLAGYFCFAIWKKNEQSIFLATDQFSKRSLLYAYKPGHSFIFANELSPFRVVSSPLTLNENMFAHFALDSLPAGETCYQEVSKLLPGHQLHLTPHGLKQSCYWRLNDQRKRLPYQTRTAYYEAFQDVFQTAVKNSLRSPYPITAHISGGLDSSSVAAQAAILLAEQQRPLLAFTAIPNGLEGPSYRKGWHYHEMPAVQTLLDRYPTIQHTSYQSSKATDIHQVLATYYPYVDQPFRNISNYDWIIGSYSHAFNQGGRVLLTGARGNSSISWAARSWKGSLSNWMRALLLTLKPENAFDGFFKNCHSDFLNTSTAKNILRRRAIMLSPHWLMLSQTHGAARNSSSYAVQLCHGIVSLDPTHDLDVVNFCYNVPDWVCREGKGITHNRLLVRRGLSHLLPEAIKNNPNRGEQAADSYLQYNQHASAWWEQMQTLSAQTKAVLNQYYDHNKYTELQKSIPLPILEPNKSTLKATELQLMRYMSAAFFLNYKMQH